MSRIGSSPSNSPELNSGNVEAEPAATPARPPSGRQSKSQVESWVPQDRPLDFQAPAFLEAQNNGKELEAQMAREAADRKSGMKAVSDLGVPLAKLAAKYPDPVGFFGNTAFTSNQVAFGSFGDALREPAFNDLVARASSADVRAALGEQVKKAWPQCDAKDLEKLTGFFMREVSESLRERAAPKLQALATKMLADTAKSFDTIAADPEEIAKLADRLNAMEGQSAARDLRAGFGLPSDDARVTPEKLGEALKDRAALLHEEATKMKKHSRPSLFRALAEQDVGSSFKQAAGIREGSLLSAQIDAVKTEGKTDQAAIDRAKWISSALAGGFTTVGLGAIYAVGAGVAMAAPKVAHAWEGAETAKAGESAGTMKAGAAEEARRKAMLETGGAVIGIAGSEAFGHGLHAAEPLAKFVGTVAIELAVEGSIDTGIEHLDEALSAEGEPNGQNVFERTLRPPESSEPVLSVFLTPQPTTPGLSPGQ